MHCTNKAYLTLIFSKIKNINIWKSFGRDYIFEHEGRVFKGVDVNQALILDELSPNSSNVLFTDEIIYL